MGEVVLITGCSRGIGLGLVDYFAKAGFKVNHALEFIPMTGQAFYKLALLVFENFNL